MEKITVRLGVKKEIKKVKVVKKTIERFEQEMEISPGELILFSTIRTDNLLGVFGNYRQRRLPSYDTRIKGFNERFGPVILFADQPHKLESTKLPGIEKKFPLFVPSETYRYHGFGEKRELVKIYYYSCRSITKLIAGKEEIINHLKFNQQNRYEKHIPIIESMKQPYVSDEKLREIMEISP